MSGAFSVSVGLSPLDGMTRVVRVGAATIGVTGDRAVLVDHRDVLALVGEIHNANALAHELGEPKPASQEGRADLVLRAWRRWGDAALDRLIGVFAGVFVDHKTGRVCVFRDLTAGMPAYLSAVGQGLIAGSDLRSIAAWGGRALAPSPLFIAEYLQDRMVDARSTPFNGVEALLPGHIAVAKGKRWQTTRVADWHVRTVRHKTTADYVEHLAELLDDAVRCRVDASSRAGVALSGGLDSTNVLASCVRVASDRRWTAYSIPFASPRGDETALQRAVAEHCGVELRWVPIAGRGPLGVHEGKLFGGRLAPPWGGNWYFGEGLATAASAEGTEILFDGEDADSLLTGGKGYLSDLLLRGRWLRLRKQLALLARYHGVEQRALLKGAAVNLLPPAIVRRLSDASSWPSVSETVAPALAASVGLADALRELPEARVWSPGRRFAALQRTAGSASHVSLVVGAVELPFQNLRLKGAHPFFDRRLMTFAMGLPWEMVHAGGIVPKMLLRELAKLRLPAEFNVKVRKANLSEYYDQAVFGVERDAVIAGLDLATRRPEWVAPTAVGRIRREFEHGKDSWAPSRLAMLMLWAEQVETGKAREWPQPTSYSQPSR